MTIFKTTFKASIFLVLFGSSIGFAYPVRFFDETGNDFVYEIGNQIDNRGDYAPNVRDENGLPLPIPIPEGSKLYLATTDSGWFPEVDFKRQSEFNPDIFECRTKKGVEVYEIIRRYDQWSCSPVDKLEKIDISVTITSKTSSEKGALVDSQPVYTTGPVKISVYKVGGHVFVSTLKGNYKIRCSVKDDILVLTADYGQVSCGG